MCITVENIRKMWMIQKKAHDGTGGIKKKIYSSPLPITIFC